MHGKNDFAEGSKNFAVYRSENNFGTLKIMSTAVNNFDILAVNLILHNYFDQQNYFSDLYPTKILDLSAKPFFSCVSI